MLRQNTSPLVLLMDRVPENVGQNTDLKIGQIIFLVWQH